MIWVFILSGLFWIAMAIGGAIGPRVSDRNRAYKEAIDRPPWMLWLAVLVGVIWLIAGLRGDVWLAAIGLALMGIAAVVSKRRTARLEDPPPMLARMQACSLNPVAPFVHPVRTMRQLVDMVRIRRNVREQREWEERRGIRPPRS